MPDAVLLAAIIGKGAASALARFGDVHTMAQASIRALRDAGITRRQAERLRCALELGRRSLAEPLRRGEAIKDAQRVHGHFRTRLAGLGVEEFWAVALDVRHRIIWERMLGRGSLSGVDVHPRDVFKPLIEASAAAVIFVHNHPSGDPSPSRADVDLTRRLREVGELCGIAVLDHVVVGWDGFVSLAARGWS